MTELMRYQAYGEVLAFLGPPAPSYLQDLPAHLVLLLPHGDHWIETHSHTPECSAPLQAVLAVSALSGSVITPSGVDGPVPCYKLSTILTPPRPEALRIFLQFSSSPHHLFGRFHLL